MRALFILIICAIGQPFFPWPFMAAVAFLAGFWGENSAKQAFSDGFLAIFLLWLTYSSYLHFSSSGLLTARVSVLFHLPHPLFLVFSTGFLGGLVAGFATLSGQQTKSLLWPSQKKTEEEEEKS